MSLDLRRYADFISDHADLIPVVYHAFILDEVILHIYQAFLI